MKKTLFYLLLLCSLSSLYSQNADISVKLQKCVLPKEKYSHPISVEEDNKGGAFILRMYGNGYRLDHFDASMKLLKHHEYEYEKYGKVLGAFTNNDKIHIVDFEYKKSEKSYVCTAYTLDVNTFSSGSKELFRFGKEEVQTTAYFRDRELTDASYMADVVFNDDKTAFAVSLDMIDKKQGFETRKIYVYSNDFDLKLENLFKRNLKERNFIFENLDISNDGTVAYLLGRAETDETKKKKKGAKYQYELTRITSSESKTQIINTGEHYINALRTVLKKDKIACVGYYSDEEEMLVDGLCYFDMDSATLDVKTAIYNPFTEQFIIDRFGKVTDEEIKGLLISNIIVTDKDEIIFNGEEYYMRMGSSGQNTVTSLHYDDIITVKIAQDGSLVWARNINKLQATDTDYTSYTSLLKGNNIYFFLNSADKPEILSENRVEFGRIKSGKTNINVIKVDGTTGEFDFKEILNFKQSNISFKMAKSAVAKSGESVYFIGKDGSKNQILKVTLE